MIRREHLTLLPLIYRQGQKVMWEVRAGNGGNIYENRSCRIEYADTSFRSFAGSVGTRWSLNGDGSRILRTASIRRSIHIPKRSRCMGRRFGRPVGRWTGRSAGRLAGTEGRWPRTGKCSCTTTGTGSGSCPVAEERWPGKLRLGGVWWEKGVPVAGCSCFQSTSTATGTGSCIVGRRLESGRQTDTGWSTSWSRSLLVEQRSRLGPGWRCSWRNRMACTVGHRLAGRPVGRKTGTTGCRLGCCTSWSTDCCSWKSTSYLAGRQWSVGCCCFRRLGHRPIGSCMLGMSTGSWTGRLRTGSAVAGGRRSVAPSFRRS